MSALEERPTAEGQGGEARVGSLRLLGRSPVTVGAFAVLVVVVVVALFAPWLAPYAQPARTAAQVTLDWNEHPEARQEYLEALAKCAGIGDGALGEEIADTADAASDLILQWADAPPPYLGLRRDVGCLVG